MLISIFVRKKLTEQSTVNFFPKSNSHAKNIERLYVSYSNYDHNLFAARIVVVIFLIANIKRIHSSFLLFLSQRDETM